MIAIVWKFNMSTEVTVYVLTSQTSGLCWFKVLSLSYDEMRCALLHGAGAGTLQIMFLLCQLVSYKLGQREIKDRHREK